MNKFVSKISDTLLCILGSILVMLIFAGIVFVGKPAGTLSHCPITYFSPYASSK